MMSADRLSRELNNDRPAARIRLWRCLLAIPAALLSTLSVSVFRYMRAFEGIGQYYSGEMQGLLRDSLSPRNLDPGAALPALLCRLLSFPGQGCAPQAF
jgi:hypothetical protein